MINAHKARNQAQQSFPERQIIRRMHIYSIKPLMGIVSATFLSFRLLLQYNYLVDKKYIYIRPYAYVKSIFMINLCQISILVSIQQEIHQT